MVRRYYRRLPRSNNRDKYSVEQTFINVPTSASWTVVPAVAGSTMQTYQFSIPVINPSSTQGMRKVKHFTLSFNAIPSDLAYALVYVPEGYDPNIINYPDNGMAISMYEPNQFVISQGVVDQDSNSARIRSPLARNLNSGDSIYLVLAVKYTANPSPDLDLLATVKYAITLQ